MLDSVPIAWRIALCVALLGLAACGGGGSASPPSVSTEPGPSPFISVMHLQNVDVNHLASVDYTIAPKPGSVSRPVHVEYSLAALTTRGWATSGNSLMLPVFGLYAGYQNQVAVQLHMQHSSTLSLNVQIATPPYSDPTGVYSQPDIATARTPGSDLGFDFILIKSGLGFPIILDTDAQIRWAAPGTDDSTSSALVGDQFVIGDSQQPLVHRLRLDGTMTQEPLPDGSFTNFHHDIARRKASVLAEVDGATNGVADLESNVIEIADSNANEVLNHWDLGAILSAYMASQGDDPSTFVRPGVDWFHNNSAIYDPSDDSLIVSSRENFVIKLDYSTGAIIWILGDPSKYWYTFASLRAKALTLAAGGLYPIGQHALSITSDGLLMLFNDGLGSRNQPAGAPAGETRTYSAVSAYSIDESSMTAREVWNYDAGQAIYSSICSSAYEADDRSLLVDYAFTSDGKAILVGLDAAHQTVFSFKYPSLGCQTSWNARPIGLDDLRISN